jgi:peptide/nickel transport system ATP-binding protein
MSEPLLLIENLRKVYPGRTRAEELVAVDGISLALGEGESVAVVGESGSGKTTIARIVVGLERATSGRLVLCGREWGGRRRPRAAERRARGREVQMVFQDPYLSLDRRQSVEAGIGEILDLHFRLTEAERRTRVQELSDQVGLDARKARSRPARLSGGERQRVSIARALAASPRILILDEAVAALDVSIQAQILNLLADIRGKTEVAYLFVSHDLAVVRHVAERVLVMHAGQIVEQGETETIFARPRHPCTRDLLDSVPGPGWKPRRRREELRR